MVSFDNVKKLHVKGDATSDFRFTDIPGEPVLRVRPATKSNPAYFNESFRRTRKTTKGLMRGDLSQDMLDEGMKVDRALYPLHIIVGWPTPPLDAEDKPAPFSTENVAAFIEALPDDLFQKLRNYCGDDANFRDGVENAGERAGNSQSGLSGN